ncbi:MAG: hypothetical protein Q4D53_07260 [Leptotrichiaceae bacterium]|nr:hypothetical protein [Leptotrichiaceae bacterium]
MRISNLLTEFMFLVPVIFVVLSGYNIFRIISNLVRMTVLKKEVKMYLKTDLISGILYISAVFILFYTSFYKLYYFSIHLMSYIMIIIIFLIQKKKKRKIFQYSAVILLITDMINNLLLNFTYPFIIFWQLTILYLILKKEKGNGKLEKYIYLSMIVLDSINIFIFMDLYFQIMMNKGY